jgi:hypothetical protein
MLKAVGPFLTGLMADKKDDSAGSSADANADKKDDHPSPMSDALANTIYNAVTKDDDKQSTTDKQNTGSSAPATTATIAVADKQNTDSSAVSAPANTASVASVATTDIKASPVSAATATADKQSPVSSATSDAMKSLTSSGDLDVSLDSLGPAPSLMPLSFLQQVREQMKRKEDIQ